MASPKQKPKQVSIKIDREDYDKILAAAKAETRPITYQLRVIFDQFFKEISA